jgi:hypothetical protein
MHIANIGAVVIPAQQLLSVVPNDDRVEVEAVLEKMHVGFVSAGKRVELKVDGFPVTRYGLLSGTVLSADRDDEAAPVSQTTIQGSQRCRLFNRPGRRQRAAELYRAYCLADGSVRHRRPPGELGAWHE